jgi:S-(hydroxymethyl)glutathione dehydrogenase/alcohol dehydrogenase
VFSTSAFAEYSLVHENQLARPDELPFPQASILGCGCVTGAGAASTRPTSSLATPSR